MYKFVLKTANYDDAYYVETNTFNVINLKKLNKNPYELKLFSNDVFNYDEETDCFEIHHSNFRSNKYNAGILDLSMSHGKKNKKLLYLCKPDDKRIPFFLIPYNIPYNFDKSIKKLYITFEFDKWDTTDKRPYGKITQNLGSIYDLNNFYEYILYCKSLNISIQQFTKDTKKKLSHETNNHIINNITKKYNLEVITKKDEFVFSIDSKKSLDFDDALSYNFKEHKISVYITNVALIMDYLNLWSSFSKRISSIYLPDKKRSMLPTILSDCLCSLKEKENKICFVLDIYYDERNKIKEQKIKVCQVYISKNFNYENSQDYENNKYFKKIVEILNLNKSKDIVTRLMIHLNHFVAKTLCTYKKGIYKSLTQNDFNINNDTTPNNLPKEIYQHINIIKNKSSSYCLYDKQTYKSMMRQDIDIYLQISSPIRRLVDVLNNIIMLDSLNLIVMSKEAHDFYNNWTKEDNIDYINTASRAIRKIQSKCQIYALHEVHKRENKNIIYVGYLFDKIEKVGDGKYQYMVYLPEIQLTSYITMLEDLPNYSKHNFNLYVFMSEENDKKKIKLQICYLK